MSDSMALHLCVEPAVGKEIYVFLCPLYNLPRVLFETRDGAKFFFSFFRKNKINKNKKL